MSERAKRLQPTSEVLRELYLKSGNKCAFPGCINTIIDENGNFIGQVCHIEAAEEGGERFNPNMTNEQRRSFSNLLLMCYEHHVVTNDVKTYIVSVLKKMKKDHEDKYSNVILKMKNSVIDYGIVTNYIKAHNCQKLSNVMQYECTHKQNLENTEIINTLIDKLIDVPIETRSFLSIMVSRSFCDSFWTCLVPLHEIEAATGKDFSYITRQIEILNRRNIISNPDLDDYGCPFCMLYGDSISGWNYWGDIREYCKKINIAIDKVCVELNFSVFDSMP